MTASLRGLPACNTEACGLSPLKNHSALLVRFAPCGQHLAHKTRRRDRSTGLRSFPIHLVQGGRGLPAAEDAELPVLPRATPARRPGGPAARRRRCPYR